MRGSGREGEQSACERSAETRAHRGGDLLCSSADDASHQRRRRCSATRERKSATKTKSGKRTRRREKRRARRTRRPGAAAPRADGQRRSRQLRRARETSGFGCRTSPRGACPNQAPGRARRAGTAPRAPFKQISEQKRNGDANKRNKRNEERTFCAAPRGGDDSASPVSAAGADEATAPSSRASAGGGADAADAALPLAASAAPQPSDGAAGAPSDGARGAPLSTTAPRRVRRCRKYVRGSESNCEQDSREI